MGKIHTEPLLFNMGKILLLYIQIRQEKDLILKWTRVATSISSSSSLHSLNPSVVHCLISHTRVATSYIHFNQSSSSNQPFSSVVHCLISNSWWCFGGVFLGMASLQVHRQQDQHLDLLRQDILETVHLIICPRIRGNLKQLEIQRNNYYIQLQSFI